MQVAAGAAFHTTSATDGRHDTVSYTLDFPNYNLIVFPRQKTQRGGRKLMSDV